MDEPPGIANRRTILAMSLFHLFGIYSMYGLILRNGYYDGLISLRDHGPYVYPGSNVPIRTTFCGIQPLDRLLTLAGVMFANVTDGSAPQLSLYAFQFAGQLVPIWIVVMIEANRNGNSKGPMSLSVLWGCAMQAMGFGFVMPVYAIVHLLRSSTARKVSPTLAASILPRDSTFIETLVPSITLGYILPTILMAIPVPSSSLHQWLGAFWQGFPVWTLLLQYVLGMPKRYSCQIDQKKADQHEQSRSDQASRINDLFILHRVYLFAFAVAATTQLTTFAILLTIKLFPSFYPQAILRSINFTDVFVPPMFNTRVRMRDMANGVHNFFQYDQYIGSAAALLWAVTLHRNSTKEPMTPKRWMWLAAEVTGLSFLVGPGGALVSLMWYRDSTVIQDEGLYSDKEY